MQSINFQDGQTRGTDGAQCSVPSTQYFGGAGANNVRRGTEHSVLRTGYSVLGPRALHLACLAVVLAAVAGCGYGPEKIRTGTKPPQTRTQLQIAEDMLRGNDEFVAMTRGVNDAVSAKNVLPKIREHYDRMKTLLVELQIAHKRATADENQQLESQYKDRMTQSHNSLLAAGLDLAQRPKIPKEAVLEIAAAAKEGEQKMKMAEEEAKNLPAPPPPEILPDNPPNSSCWAVWLICLIILASCVGFLFRDGLWSNALKLVNVVFAGLLAMNFHEWLANLLTTYSDMLHPYVAFFDFLALWICFILFMAVFRAATEAVSRVRVRFLQIVDRWGGIALSLCIGWVMVFFTLVSLHAAPLGQYPLLGSFQPQANMFFGMLAPDRQWLAFTKYQSQGTFCRTVGQEQVEQCTFPPNKFDKRDYLTKHLERRMHLEYYILGNNDHAILINPQMMTPAKPAPH